MNTKVWLSQAGRDLHLRMDAKNVVLVTGPNNHDPRFIELGALADVREMIPCERPDGPFKYHEISSLDEYGLGDPYPLEDEPPEPGSEEERVFTKVNRGDISKPSPGCVLLPKVRPHLGKAALITEARDEYFSTAFLELHPRNISSELLYSLLRHPFVRLQLERISRIGKGYPTIGRFDLSRSLRLPATFLSPNPTAEQYISRATRQLHDRLLRLRQESEIITSVFADALKTSQAITSNPQHFHVSRSALNAAFDLRLSAHFLRPAHRLLLRSLKNVPTVKMDRLCRERTSLGISPEYSDTDTGFYYLGPQAMTKERLNQENLAPVPEQFFKSNEWQSGVRPGDVFLRRSGASLGKVLYYDSSLPCIFSDFLMRLRLKDDTLAKYVSYWMRSAIFQEILRCAAVVGKGLRNVYPSQIDLAPVPFEKEDRSEITVEIDRQLMANENQRQEAARQGAVIETYLTEQFALPVA